MIMFATGAGHALASPFVAGLSPRGALTLVRAAQALAAARGRDYATPDDVKTVAVPVMSHRLIAHPEARMSGFSSERFVTELLQTIAVEEKTAA
jgi:MoxR-like ATPase